jgi:hydrogenase maturation protein HypF
MYKFTIRGVVQGVGFRPYIYNACKKLGLVGYVQNVGTGVEIVVNDKNALIDILKNPPPLAKIDRYEIEEVSGVYTNFEIKESAGGGFSEIPADLYLCEDCLQELKNPSDRRFNYFFTTCTNCGPRFTITKQTPYDRINTAMDEFPMCSECKKEYESPTSRRYHAQTIACHNCGPRLALIIDGKNIDADDASLIRKTADLLRNGEIVAIKGVGGFHLMCAAQSSAIQKLRGTTKREHKPYAIMCRDIEMAEQIAHINDIEKKGLLSARRPIMLLKKKEVSLQDASELDTIGVMLPYTALHYLLFNVYHEPLVMTSSNVPDGPITTKREEQFVPHVLDHSRKIENPADDSVVKVIDGNTFFIRRSRGSCPQSIPIQTESTKQILALGAELNNTFCILKDKKAILSQYMGTTSNLGAFENYKKSIDKFLQFTNTKPDIILCDLHPQYNTSLYGHTLAKRMGIPIVSVQHHKAHSYSVAAEHNIKDFVAIVCDGLGFGEDNTIWGGEIFDGNSRVGHLEPQLQLGGDSATQYPAKMLFSILRNFLDVKDAKQFLANHFTDTELTILDRQRSEKFNAPITTSCGRILDAVSVLIGFCDRRTYDGRPAMVLEAHSTTPYDLEPVIKNNILMTTPIFEYIVKNIHSDKARLAATAQLYIARGLYTIAQNYKKPIIFGGGCAYNRIMSSFMLSHGVLMNKNIPCGDGGISFGQIAYYLANSGDDVAVRHV